MRAVLFCSSLPLTFALSACFAPDEEPDLGTCTPVEGEQLCDGDRACPGGACVRANPDDECGFCVRILCLSDEDCEDDEACDLERARCEPVDSCELLAARDGCEGEGALCAPVSEERDEQCNAPRVTSCEIVPSVVMATNGRSAIVDVLALDVRGRPLPVSAELALPPSLDAVASCAGPGACRDVVTATIALPDEDVTCTARSIVLPELATGARIVVRDLDTGAPLAGANVVVDGVVAESDEDGVALFPELGGGSIEFARADIDGYETGVVVSPDGTNVEILVARVPVEAGAVAGKLFRTDTDALVGLGDFKIALGSLSTPDLVDALSGATLSGPSLDTVFEIEGVTAPGGELIDVPSAATFHLNVNPVRSEGVALARPGARLLSGLGAQVGLAETGPIISAWADDGDQDNDGVADSDSNNDGVVNEDDIVGEFDGVLGFWELGQRSMAFDLAGTVTPDEAVLRETADLAAFDVDPNGPVELRPALDTTDEIDVVVPPLPEGHDAAFVALYAHVPGRGFLLLALRFASDVDDDGIVGG